MNRFFSKLDLRDIKVDPRTSRFLPDAEDEEIEPPEPGTETPARAVDQPAVNGLAAESAVDRPRYVPSWAPAPAEPAAEVATDAPDAADAPEPLPEASTDDAVDAGVVREEAEDGVVQGTVQGQVEVLKVSARSRPSAVAGAIAGVVRENGRAEVQAIGAGATNQAVKAVAIARDYLRETGIEAICLPAFIDVTIENEDRTAIRLVIEPR